MDQIMTYMDPRTRPSFQKFGLLIEQNITESSQRRVLEVGELTSIDAAFGQADLFEVLILMGHMNSLVEQNADEYESDH